LNNFGYKSPDFNNAEQRLNIFSLLSPEGIGELNKLRGEINLYGLTFLKKEYNRYVHLSHPNKHNSIFKALQELLQMASNHSSSLPHPFFKSVGISPNAFNNHIPSNSSSENLEISLKQWLSFWALISLLGGIYIYFNNTFVYIHIYHAYIYIKQYTLKVYYPNDSTNVSESAELGSVRLGTPCGIYSQSNQVIQ